MDKKELIELLAQLDACEDALDWIEGHPSEDIETIYNDCCMVNWLFWLYITLFPIPNNLLSIRAELDQKIWELGLGFEFSLLELMEVTCNPELRDLFMEYLPKIRLGWPGVLAELEKAFNG